MRFATITTATLALTLTACGSESSGTFTTDEGETGEYTIDGDSGETSMTIDTPEGEASMRAGSNVKPDLPQGWTVFPGATVVNAINVDGADGAGSMVTMTTDASADDVIAHYRGQAEATGYTIEMEMTTQGSTIIGGTAASGATFSVSVAPGADGGPSMVQLTMAE